MKKHLYLSLLIVLLCGINARAQYHISGIFIRPTPICAVANFTVTVSGSLTGSGLNFKTIYGDGFTDTTAVAAFNIAHTYAWPGTYTIKVVLFSGSTLMDSATFSISIPACNFFGSGAFIDANSNCILDPGEGRIMTPATVEVDSAGMAIDTVTWSGGYMHICTGPAGTIYAFKLLSSPLGASLTCPAGGILYDTISGIAGFTRYFAFQCTPSPAFDAEEFISTSATTSVTVGPAPVGASYYRFFASFLDNSCSAHTDTFTMTTSSKYALVSSSITPLSVVGNVVTWVLPGLSITSNPIHLQGFLHSISPVLMGDTLHNKFVITPITGDANPANNTVNTVDTIKFSYDPNEKSVSPQGIITAGTQLQYTIDFENTGNDTAHNIYVMDTLSDNLDAKSLITIGASANVTTIPRKVGSLNIVKFDFPGINLLDSSHHGQCDGMVVFTINTKAGLPNGTTIFNHAGIFFDDNPVVMTDTVENIIGIPTTAIATMSNITKVEVYPNPTNDILTIKVDNGTYNTMCITNTIGQVVATQQVNGIQTNVSTKALTAGLYYVTLRGDSGVKVLRFEKL